MTTPHLTEADRAFWEIARRATGATGPVRGAFAFGDSPALRDALLALVLEGRKRATCARRAEFDGLEGGPPRPGDLWIVHDGAGRPACLIRTLSVRVAPLGAVTDEFAWTEGEGDRTRATWLADHRAYFAREGASEGHLHSDAMEAVFERFEVLYPAPGPAVAASQSRAVERSAR